MEAPERGERFLLWSLRYTGGQLPRIVNMGNYQVEVASTQLVLWSDLTSETRLASPH